MLCSQMHWQLQEPERSPKRRSLQALGRLFREGGVCFENDCLVQLNSGPSLGALRQGQGTAEGRRPDLDWGRLPSEDTEDLVAARGLRK